MRFYPSKFELAKQNEAISVVYSRPLDLLGPKPDDFPINPRFTEVNGRQIVDIPVCVLNYLQFASLTSRLNWERIFMVVVRFPPACA